MDDRLGYLDLREEQELLYGYIFFLIVIVPFLVYGLFSFSCNPDLREARDHAKVRFEKDVKIIGAAAARIVETAITKESGALEDAVINGLNRLHEPYQKSIHDLNDSFVIREKKAKQAHDDKIQALNDTIASLSRDSMASATENAALAAEVKQLKGNSVQTKSENTGLQKKVESLEVENADLCSQLEMLETEKESTRSTTAKEVEELENKVAKLETEKEELQDRCDNFYDVAEQRKRDVEELEHALEKAGDAVRATKQAAKAGRALSQSCFNRLTDILHGERIIAFMCSDMYGQAFEKMWAEVAGSHEKALADVKMELRAAERYGPGKGRLPTGGVAASKQQHERSKSAVEPSGTVAGSDFFAASSSTRPFIFQSSPAAENMGVKMAPKAASNKSVAGYDMPTNWSAIVSSFDAFKHASKDGSSVTNPRSPQGLSTAGVDTSSAESASARVPEPQKVLLAPGQGGMHDSKYAQKDGSSATFPPSLQTSSSVVQSTPTTRDDSSDLLIRPQVLKAPGKGGMQDLKYARKDGLSATTTRSPRDMTGDASSTFAPATRSAPDTPFVFGKGGMQDPGFDFGLSSGKTAAGSPQSSSTPAPDTTMTEAEHNEDESTVSGLLSLGTGSLSDSKHA